MTPAGGSAVVGALGRGARAVPAIVRTIRRRGAVRDAVATIRSASDAAVVVYHRVAARSVPRHEIVPTVPRDLFRRQLEVLGDRGRIVPLRSPVEGPGGDRRPTFALTFDDDLGSHVDEVLPVLRDAGVPAAFFLSGRALHGLGGYWFERLEALVLQQGVASSALMLGVTADTELELAGAYERDPRAQGVLDEVAPRVDCSLRAAGIRDLVSAEMGIGFHTLHHPVLTSLDDEALRASLMRGREELEAVAGHAFTWLAYPHGKADVRTASAVRAAGFTDAWTTMPDLAMPNDDAPLRGRWDPLPLPPDHMVFRLARLLAARGASS